MNVSISAVYQGQKVMRDGSPELQRAVSAGAVKVSTAAGLACLKHEEQDAALAQGAAKVRAKAKEGAQRRKAAAEAANDGAVRRDRTVGDGVQNAAAEAGAVKKQNAEGERFQRFLHALTELEAAWKLDKGGFVTQARKLAQKERGRLKALLDNHAARAKKLCKAIGA